MYKFQYRITKSESTNGNVSDCLDVVVKGELRIKTDMQIDHRFYTLQQDGSVIIERIINMYVY